MKDIDGYVTKDNLYRVISRIKYKPDIVVDNTTCNIIIEAIYAMPKADVQPTEKVEEYRSLLEECERKLLHLLDCEIESSVEEYAVNVLINKIRNLNKGSDNSD